MGRRAFDYSSPNQPLPSAHDASNTTAQNRSSTDDGALVAYLDTYNGFRCESQSLPCLDGGQRTLDCSKLNWVDKLDGYGRAGPATEIGIASEPGLPPSKLRHSCNFTEGDMVTRDPDGENAMFWQVEAGTNYAPQAESMSSDYAESNVSEYENWVWRLFSTWIDNMYPDASRECD